MRMRKGTVTPRQEYFARLVARTGNPALAAREAGYSQPPSQASALVRNPAVVARIQAEQRAILRTEGAEVGVRTLITIAGDESQPASARVAAAKHLVVMAGVGQESEDGEKPIYEMSRAELASLAADARRQLAELEAQENTIEGEALGGVFS